MRRPKALIFDFDGVLLESEFELNRLTAELLTELGHETTTRDALELFTGLSGRDVIGAIEGHIGGAVPDLFHERMKDNSRRVLKDGSEEVVGAIRFVRSLPADLPKAVASSSSTKWLYGHLDHLGLAQEFGPHVYSGHEHVDRGKPEPDIYLYAAEQLSVPIAECAIIEDSRVGVTGALASGARVIGFVGGSHCLDDHQEALRSLGATEIAHDFDEVRRLLDL